MAESSKPRPKSSDATSAATSTAASLADARNAAVGAAVRNIRKAAQEAGSRARQGAKTVSGDGGEAIAAARGAAVNQAARVTRKDTQAFGAKASRPRGPNGRFVSAAKDTARGVAAGGSFGTKAVRAVAVANPAMLGVAGYMQASSAYKAAKDGGASTGQAALAAATAAAPTAAAAAAPTVVGRIAPNVGMQLAKAAKPLTFAALAYGAISGGVKAYRAGGSVGEIAKRSALGAADAVSFGAASLVHDKLTGKVPEQPLSKAPGPLKEFRTDTTRTYADHVKESKGHAARTMPLMAQGVTKAPAAQAQAVRSNTPAAAPRQSPQDVQKGREKAQRESYTNVRGEVQQHTRKEVEAYRRRMQGGASSGPERKRASA